MRPSLWSSGQSSGYRSRGPGFDSQRYQNFREVMHLERGPLSLVSTIEGLLKIKSSESSLESREYGCKGCAAPTKQHHSIDKEAGTSPTSGSRSLVTVRSRTQARSLFFCLLLLYSILCMYVSFLYIMVDTIEPIFFCLINTNFLVSSLFFVFLLMVLPL
jgi:hypothetical protein